MLLLVFGSIVNNLGPLKGRVTITHVWYGVVAIMFEKIDKVVSDNAALAQNITELRSIVMREPGQNMLNSVLTPHGVFA